MRSEIKKPINIKLTIILIPVVGCIIPFLFTPQLLGAYKPYLVLNVIHSVSMTVGLWVGCLCIVTYLWKKFPWEQFPVKHIIYEILAILIFTNTYSIVLHYAEHKSGIIPVPHSQCTEMHLGIVVTNLITFLITAISEAVYFYLQWKQNFSKSMVLERDNIEAKYETLKQQINPHFLFNSLNSLALMVDDNKQAVDYIQNLSDFLRYILKSRDRELVLVRDEMIILQKYIDLQKTRFTDNLIIKTEVPESCYHFALPPLVLQMLMENCIKHNIISESKPLTIKILYEKETIIMENNLQLKNDVPSTGQGLKNISDRIAFFTTRELKVIETVTTFRVEVPLLTIEI
jgi:two-component system, LytTR family, sensor kinase